MKIQIETPPQKIGKDQKGKPRGKGRGSISQSGKQASMITSRGREDWETIVMRWGKFWKTTPSERGMRGVREGSDST